MDRPFQQLCFVLFLEQSIFFHQMTTYLQRFFFGGQPASAPNQSGTHYRSRSDRTNYIYGPPARSASSVASFSATSSRSNSPSATPMVPSPLRYAYDNAAVQARSFGFQRQNGPERSIIHHREIYRPMGSGTPRDSILFFVRTLSFVIDAVAASSASSRSDSSSSLVAGMATSSSTYATSTSSVNAARPSRYPYQDNPSNTGVPRQLLSFRLNPEFNLSSIKRQQIVFTFNVRLLFIGTHYWRTAIRTMRTFRTIPVSRLRHPSYSIGQLTLPFPITFSTRLQQNRRLPLPPNWSCSPTSYLGQSLCVPPIQPPGLALVFILPHHARRLALT